MSKSNKVGIIGLGYVGAPLAYLAAITGYTVIGIDNNEEAIENMNRKINAPNELHDKLDKVELIASNDYSLLRDTDIIIICVPTPTINNKPDTSILKNVISGISKFIKRGCLIIVESTVAPGMTREYVEQYLLKKEKLIINKDYYLAYCPERIDPGNKKFWVGNINRVCGASSDYALNKACEFYQSMIKARVIPMESIEEAELVKVWENSMRNVSIAQANLLAMMCDKYHFSVEQVLEGLNSKVEQFGLTLAYPGIGPGGHCIPEDIHYLINTSEKDIDINMNLLKEAVKINEEMPRYAYDKIKSIIQKSGEKVEKMKFLMLGISYKPNSADIRKSQALVLYNLIKNDNQKIDLYDPIAKYDIKDISSKKIFEKKISEADIIIVGCAHDIFLQLDYTHYKNVKYILDCWNKLDESKIEKAGIHYIGVGK
ncbi:MAG: nucleotide sugar dehydrogenase [Clostridia bacterium]|nr:nucleotide sugar dehydrogenase [Clostridia bacterium]